jgi:hypothetical protein
MFWIVLMCWCQKWFLKNEKNIIDMYFDIKSYLKSTYNHTVKHTLNLRERGVRFREMSKLLSLKSRKSLASHYFYSFCLTFNSNFFLSHYCFKLQRFWTCKEIQLPNSSFHYMSHKCTDRKATRRRIKKRRSKVTKRQCTFCSRFPIFILIFLFHIYIYIYIYIYLDYILKVF